jgi:ABC-type sugar transport system ATPase subunit
LRGLGRSPKLLILDEATSALTAADVERITRRTAFALKGSASSTFRIARGITAFADDCSVFGTVGMWPPLPRALGAAMRSMMIGATQGRLSGQVGACGERQAGA